MLAQCGADFHGSKDRYKRFLQAYDTCSPDVILLAGDLGNVDITLFKSIEIPIFAIYGNMDGNLTRLEKKIEFIDGRTINYKGICMLGIGTKPPEDITGNVDVLLTHVPPHRTKDKTFFGMHIGSKMVRALMEKNHPRFVICGHVHEDAGYDKYGSSYVVNCSVGKRGAYTLIDFTDDTIEMVGYHL
jgi:Icc-related predicted phosphoesterase